MMKSKYGTFTDDQFLEFKKKLHSKIHWLLVYKENDSYNYDFRINYFNNVLQYVGGLNEIIEDNALIIDLLVTLRLALDEELKKDRCDFKIFRKNILEAHSIIDRL